MSFMTCSLRILSLDSLTNLRQVTCSDLADYFLPRLLPAYWRGKRDTIWDARVKGQPSEDWVEQLWAFLKVCHTSAYITLLSTIVCTHYATCLQGLMGIF